MASVKERVYIYSDERVDGIKGIHANPIHFKGPIPGATKVYTDNNAIADAYKAVGVKVEPITKKPVRKKSAKSAKEE